MSYLTTNEKLLNWKQISEYAIVRPTSEWRYVFGFDIIRPPFNPRYSPVLEKLISDLGGGEGAVLSMRPFTNYVWHTDATRNCSINIPINDAPSFSMFGTQKKNYTPIWECKIVEYRQLGTATLFNTQAMHSVLNLNNTRLMWSIDFPKGVSYGQLVAEYKARLAQW